MIKNDLRSVQLVQLAILKEFDRICKKHKLTYWLDAGTLLGAVRHGGFIPWDDDLDVGMPSADYKKFLEIVEQELPSNLFLQTKKTDAKAPFLYAKLRDNNSLFVDYGMDMGVKFHRGVYIDIFEYVDYPKLSKKSIRFFYKTIGKPIAVLSTRHYLSLKTVTQYFVFNIERVVFKLIWRLINSFAKKRHLGNTIEDNGYFVQHSFETIFPVKSISYEGNEFDIPNNQDAYLKTLYGDYMKFPPEEDRKGHAFMYFTNLNENN
jgi:lipopolysaccharide cholinephosphotransferase